MSQEVVIPEQIMPGGIVPFQEMAVVRHPRIVLEEAQAAASCLMEVVKQKPKPVMINGEQYLELDDWETVGRFYGVMAKVKWCRPIQVGDARGWEAQVALYHLPTGLEVGSGEGMCLNDEEKWNVRTKYEWHYVKRSGGASLDDPGKDEIIWEKNAKTGKSRPKKVKVKIGDEPVPSFQLRSMAQTRAASKAFRLALSWVVVLAGFKSTPAEEMPGYGEPSSPEPVEKDEPSNGDAGSGIPGAITEQQQKILQARMKENGWLLDDGLTAVPEAVEYLGKLGYELASQIPQKDFAGAMIWFSKKRPVKK